MRLTSSFLFAILSLFPPSNAILLSEMRNDFPDESAEIVYSVQQAIQPLYIDTDVFVHKNVTQTDHPQQDISEGVINVSCLLE